MIDSFWVKNYRSLADVRLDLAPLTVLVGPNGSGKSNLIDVLRFVSEALQHGLDSAVIRRHGMSALRRWSAKGRPFDVEIGMVVRTGALLAEYRLTLGSELRGEYRVKSERFETLGLIRGEGEPAGVLAGELAGFEVNNGQWLTTPPGGVAPALQPTALALPLLTGLAPFRDVYHALVDMSFYNIVPSDLTEPQRPSNAYPLAERGENLATLLRELKRENNQISQDLERALRSVLGDTEGYQVSQVGAFLVTRLRHLTAESGRAPLFELSQESDGTLRLLGILAALYQYPPRTLIGLEEPELTIHPGALSLLWEEIVDATQRFKERTQVVLTTHSPDLLDMCTADQLCVVEKISGVTHVVPLLEDKRAIIQKRLFAPGQLLQAQGLQRAGT